LLLGQGALKVEGATHWVRCGWQEHGAMNGKAGFNEDCSSMIILNRYEYGVDGTTTSKKLLTRARDTDLFVLQYHALSRMPMGCPQTKTHAAGYGVAFV
jgi:hypothetical protein